MQRSGGQSAIKRLVRSVPGTRQSRYRKTDLFRYLSRSAHPAPAGRFLGWLLALPAPAGAARGR